MKSVSLLVSWWSPKKFNYKLGAIYFLESIWFFSFVKPYIVTQFQNLRSLVLPGVFTAGPAISHITIFLETWVAGTLHARDDSNLVFPAECSTDKHVCDIFKLHLEVFFCNSVSTRYVSVIGLHFLTFICLSEKVSLFLDTNWS